MNRGFLTPYCLTPIELVVFSTANSKLFSSVVY
jgi:hypothetical protein